VAAVLPTRKRGKQGQQAEKGQSLKLTQAASLFRRNIGWPALRRMWPATRNPPLGSPAAGCSPPSGKRRKYTTTGDEKATRCSVSSHLSRHHSRHGAHCASVGNQKHPPSHSPEGDHQQTGRRQEHLGRHGLKNGKRSSESRPQSTAR